MKCCKVPRTLTDLPTFCICPYLTWFFIFFCVSGKKNMTPQQTIPPEGQNQVSLARPLSSQVQLGRKQRASRVATSDGSISDARQFLLCTWSEQFINLGVVGNRIQHLINVFCKIQVDSASLNGTAEVTGFINWLAAQGGNAGFVLCILSGWEWINILEL